MAKAVSRIEQQFFLKTIFDQQLPVIYLRNRTQYTLVLCEPIADGMCFKSDRHISGLWPRRKIYLAFHLGGMIISFAVAVITCRNVYVRTELPKFLYKNLERSYARIPTPRELHARFTISNDDYFLPYPRLSGVETAGGDMGTLKDVDTKNLPGLMAQIAEWTEEFTDNYQLILFNNASPITTEERLLAETGKILYIPSTTEEFPKTDSSPQKRLITEEMFHRFLENSGAAPSELHDAVRKYLNDKVEAQIYADVYVPILFHRYVIGYCHAWCTRAERKQPFNYETLEAFFRFASALSLALEENGSFEKGKLQGRSFEARMLDVSVAGLLLACTQNTQVSTLSVNDEMDVSLSMPDRIIQCRAKIARKDNDAVMMYFGCKFLDLQPDDLRFLFEFLYGRPFIESDTLFLAGQV